MSNVNEKQPFFPSKSGVQEPKFYFIPMEATAIVRLNKLDLKSLTDKVKMREIFGDEDLTRFLVFVNLFRTRYRHCNPNLNQCMETPFDWELVTKLRDSPYYESFSRECEASIDKKASDLAKAKANNNIIEVFLEASELYRISPLTMDSCYLVEIHEDFIIALKDRDMEFKFISDCLKVLCAELSYEIVAAHYLMFNGYVRSMPCVETV